MSLLEEAVETIRCDAPGCEKEGEKQPHYYAEEPWSTVMIHAPETIKSHWEDGNWERHACCSEHLFLVLKNLAEKLGKDPIDPDSPEAEWRKPKVLR